MPYTGPSTRSIASRLLLLMVGLMLLVLGLGVVVVVTNRQHDVTGEVRQRVSNIAVTAAAAPGLAALIDNSKTPQQAAAILQPFAESIRKQTNVDFVVIMRPDGTRLTHPTPANIGKEYLGSRSEALAGQTHLEVYTGTLGSSVRAITPVYDASGRIVGLVAAGVTEANISIITWQRITSMSLVGAFGVLLGIGGSLLIVRWIKGLTLGMGPTELARMYMAYDAALGSTHEGLLLLDADGVILSVNPQAQHLLELPGTEAGTPAARANLPTALLALIEAAEPVTDRLVLTSDRLLAVNLRSTVRNGRRVGTVLTLRDHTELQSLHGELDRLRGFSRALRAQAHESANRMHTVISLIELGESDQAVTFAVEDLRIAQQLTDQVVAGVGDRAVAALLLAKSAQGAQQGIDVVLADGFELPEGVCPARDLVTIVGNLVDNAFDAAQAAPPPRRVTVAADADEDVVEIVVTDSGTGLSEQEAVAAFAEEFTTKPLDGAAGPRGLGLGLVRQAVARHGGQVVAEPGPHGRFVVRLPRVLDTERGMRWTVGAECEPDGQGPPADCGAEGRAPA